MVFLGSVIDITDNFSNLNTFVVIGDTVAEAFLEKVVGSLVGYSLILLGFFQWLPVIARVRKGEGELTRYSEQLGTLVEARTAELTLANRRLLHEIADRNKAVASAEEMNRWLMESESELDRTFKEMAGLYEISGIFSTIGDLGTKASAALEKVAVLARADWVTLRMPKDDEPGLHLVAVSGPEATKAAPVNTLTGAMTMSMAAFTEGRRIVIDDYAAMPNATQILVDLGMQSMVILPVKARDRTVGSVTVISKDKRHFSTDLVDLLTAVVGGLVGLIETRCCMRSPKKHTWSSGAWLKKNPPWLRSPVSLTYLRTLTTYTKRSQSSWKNSLVLNGCW